MVHESFFNYVTHSMRLMDDSPNFTSTHTHMDVGNEFANASSKCLNNNEILNELIESFSFLN